MAITVVKRNLSIVKGNCGKLNVQSLNVCLAGNKGNKHFDVTTKTKGNKKMPLGL